jgi:hypothetical protein
MTGVLRHNPEAGRLAVTWEDGDLSGDRIAVAALEAAAEELDGTSIGPIPGRFTDTNHLASALSTVILAWDWVFEPGTITTSGRVPTAPYKAGRVY